MSGMRERSQSLDTGQAERPISWLAAETRLWADIEDSSEDILRRTNSSSPRDTSHMQTSSRRRRRRENAKARALAAALGSPSNHPASLVGPPARWSRVVTSTSPAPRNGHATARVGSMIYFFGGFGGRRVFNDLLAFDTSTCSWKDMKSGVETPGWPSPGQRYGHTLTAVGEFLFVTGGYTMNGWTSEVWVYSIRERRWAMLNVKGDVPLGRAAHSTVVIGCHLIVFGGNNENTQFNDVHSLDVLTFYDASGQSPSTASSFEQLTKDPFTWKLLTTEGQPPWPRAGHSAVVCSRWHGQSSASDVGSDGEGPRRASESVDSNNSVPGRKSNGSEPQEQDGRSGGGDMIVFAGGDTTCVSNDVHVLRVTVDRSNETEATVHASWRTPAMLGSLPPARAGHTAEVLRVRLPPLETSSSSRSSLSARGRRAVSAKPKGESEQQGGELVELWAHCSRPPKIPAPASLNEQGIWKPPYPRAGHSATLDVTGQHIFIFGGADVSTVFNDLTALHTRSLLPTIEVASERVFVQTPSTVSPQRFSSADAEVAFGGSLAGGESGSSAGLELSIEDGIVEGATQKEGSAWLNEWLPRRSMREELVRRNILKDREVAPSLQATRQELQKFASRASLERKLNRRPSKGELVNRRIIPENSDRMDPRLLAVQQSLSRKKAGDHLAHLLERRPERNELLSQNILPPSNVAPSLIQAQRGLQRRKTEDMLSSHLAERPRTEQKYHEQSYVEGGSSASILSLLRDMTLQLNRMEATVVQESKNIQQRVQLWEETQRRELEGLRARILLAEDALQTSHSGGGPSVPIPPAPPLRISPSLTTK